MADFEEAYKKTMGHEGTYVIDPTDAGGETYCGISRRWFPDWEGWAIIDASRSKDGFPKSLDDDGVLQSLIPMFYKQHFWNRFQGDKIKDQRVADELFDTAVNMSVSDSVKFLQGALNVLNRNQALFPDMTDDGVLGPTTLDSLHKYCRGGKDDVVMLLKIMNVMQGQHYIDYMGKSPMQEKFCRGWFKRVEITKV